MKGFAAVVILKVGFSAPLRAQAPMDAYKRCAAIAASAARLKDAAEAVRQSHRYLTNPPFGFPISSSIGYRRVDVRPSG